MSTLTVCGNSACDVVLKKIKECASCRARSYCGTECQKADWPTHRLYCEPKHSRSDDAHTILTYNRQHRTTFVAMALEFLGFFREFAHLKGADRLKLLARAQSKFLHIYLDRVRAPPRGRQNRVAFRTARLDDLDRLPAATAMNIRLRLSDRFPAVCLGYTIRGEPEFQDTVTTITHCFEWFPFGVGIAKTVRLVWLSEWILRTEAKQAQAARDAELKRQQEHAKKKAAAASGN